MFERVLVANRGEIAVRVMAACQELGIRAIAVYSEADRDALHVRRADEAHLIGPAPAAQSYLSIPAVLAAARGSGAQAIHPGYGFLSENAEFAQACADAGFVFIGPPPSAMRLMGSKTAAKRAVEAAGVPTVPGYMGDAREAKALLKEAQRIGFPLLIKASAGGGGKGMRVVGAPGEFAPALESARREALAAFGDDSVFLEKLIVAPRHVEFQVLADAHGTVIHLGERECSIQRRHQKVLEESPCVALAPRLREEMGAAAVAAARAAGYVNAGTCEFLLSDDGRYYFLEMNTRLQVEHPVTELVTGLDLVHLQLQIAAGERLALRQSDISARGHAIEVRLYAEDPARGYLPSIGTVAAFAPPVAPGVRLDAGVEAGDQVGVHYDPLLAKLIVHAPDRAAAVARLRWALDHFAVLGVGTNLALLRAIAAAPDFAAGRTHIDWLEQSHLAEDATSAELPPLLLAALAAHAAGARVEPGAPGGRRNPWAAGALAPLGGTRAFHLRAGERDVRFTQVTEPGGHGAFRLRLGEREFPPEGQPALRATVRGDAVTLRLGDTVEALHVARQGARYAVAWRGQVVELEQPLPPDVDAAARGAETASGLSRLAAPMAGTIVKVNVRQGARFGEHETLMVMGAMKMEHAIAAPFAGRVLRVLHGVGDVVPGGEALVEIEADALDGARGRGKRNGREGSA
jgi:3-methylcrotonyl-CoA carboxylase alpha subunit